MQLDLGYDGRAVWEHAGDRLLGLIEDVIELRGVKQVAYDLDLRASDVVNAVKRRDRHYFRIEQLPYFIMHAPSDALVAFLAELRGLEVQKVKPLEPIEELERLRVAGRETLGEAWSLVEAKVRGKR